MEARRSLGWRMFLPLMMLLVLAALWSIWWAVVFTIAKAEYSLWTQRLSARGITLGCAEQGWGGYPFRIEMTCREPKLAITAEGIAVSAARVSALVQAYNPTHGLVLLTGPTTMTPAAGAAPLSIGHGLARGSLRLVDEEHWQASFEAPDVVADRFGNAKSVTVHGREGDAGRVEVAGTAVGLSLALGTGQPLVLDRADVTAVVPAAVLSADPIQAAAATAAPMEITRLELIQDRLAVSGSGTVNLDGQGRIEGKLSTAVSDLDLLLERATAQLNLKPEDVAAAKTLLGVLKAAGLRIDIVAKAGKLYWGPIKFAELPPLID